MRLPVALSDSRALSGRRRRWRTLRSGPSADAQGRPSHLMLLPVAYRESGLLAGRYRYSHVRKQGAPPPGLVRDLLRSGVLNGDDVVIARNAQVERRTEIGEVDHGRKGPHAL